MVQRVISFDRLGSTQIEKPASRFCRQIVGLAAIFMGLSWHPFPSHFIFSMVFIIDFAGYA